MFKKNHVPWNKGKTAWNKDKSPSDATRKKMSKSAKKRWEDPLEREKQSDAKRGKPSGREGTKHSDASKKKQRDSHLGTKRTEIAKKKTSATLQGIPYDEWEDFACEKKYCPKFNEACKESNRDKYERRCFICNKTEKANGQKLSVHHVDMDRAQGCESNWKLVPLCMKCHPTAHNDELISRLGYLIKEV